MYEELDLPGLIALCLDSRTRDRGWNVLVRRYYVSVWTFARRLLNGFPDARQAGAEPEDIMQAVWTRLCDRRDRALKRFEGQTEAEWRAYLFRTARNVLIDEHRKQGSKRRPQMTRLPEDETIRLMNEIVDPAPDPQRELEKKEIGERFEGALRRCWSGSPTLERDILISQLHFYDGMSAVSIEAMLDPGITAKGIEKVFKRAKDCFAVHHGGPGARSRDLDDGSRETPDDLHWPDGEALLDFLSGNVSSEEKDRRIAHASRCDACRDKLLEGWRVLLAQPTEQEVAAFKAAHPQGEEEAVQSILATIRRHETQAVPRSSRPRWRAHWSGIAAAAAAILLLLSPTLRPPSTDRPVGEVGDLIDVGVGDHLDAYAPFYPLQAWGPLRLAQDFTPDDRAVRRAGDAVDVDDEVRRKLSRAVQELQIEFAMGRAHTPADSVAYHNALGHLFLAENRLADAERSYETALGLAPDNATALVGRAITLHRRSQSEDLDSATRRRYLERADDYLARVPSVSAYYEHALYNRAQVALDQGEVERALTLMGELEDRDRASGTRGLWTERLRREIDARSTD